LFEIIRQLVLWENTTNEKVLQQARDEIRQSWRYTCAENADHPRAKELFERHKLPAFHDPFAGGGALPLEAQRLGLESYASDLNPVAVLINKAMIEIPPKFAGKPPVNPDAQQQKEQMAKTWHGAQGLAEDVRFYGQWMRDEAEKRIGNLYPKVEITPEMTNERPDLMKYLGKNLNVIAWLWARTVKSPNPAFAQVEVPLASTFKLSAQDGNEVYVEPVIESDGYYFMVKVGKLNKPQTAKNGTSAGKRAAFKCVMSGTPIPYDYIRGEGMAGRMGARLMAIVAKGERGRIYLTPTKEHQAIAQQAHSDWKPDLPLEGKGRVNVSNYGLNTFGDLFTPRQLVALTTFSDLVNEARERIECDARVAGLPHDARSLAKGGIGATAYADAVGVYLGFGVDKLSDRHSTLTRWDPTPTASGIINTFSRQALPMSWDYSEGNPFSEASGNFDSGIGWIAQVIDYSLPATILSVASTADAATQLLSSDKVVSTDPPYYDNIAYADLSDFFYVWMRRSQKRVFPDLFVTLGVPKAEELTAFANRHNGKAGAQAFFLGGMTEAMHRLAEQAHPAFPVTIYYAFKQAESDATDGKVSTGWDTFLDAVIRAGFGITGTWPMRTELSNRMIGTGSNALASSIILVCRPRTADASTATRREFVTALKAELPEALRHLQRGNIAPVDLAQAAIGPGMAVYTRYSKVLDAEGKPLPVREALALINQTLDETLAEQEGDFDSDSRWALTWFEQVGFDEGEYGLAEQLSKSKNTSVAGMVEAGILESKRGKVRLLRPEELPSNWDPMTDPRLTAWEMVHHLIRILEAGGEKGAKEIMAKLGSKSEVARELCYRLYTLCERKKRAAEALSYNGLVQSWPEITRLAHEESNAVPEQTTMFGTSEE
jgi:putative DNA methylase